MTHRACTIFYRAFYRKNFASTWLDNQVQEPDQVRHRKPSTTTTVLINRKLQPLPKRLFLCPCVFAKLATDPKSGTDERDWWSPGHMPQELAAREAGNLNIRQTASTRTHRAERPNPERWFRQQGAKHNIEGTCGVWTKPSTTTQLDSFYFLWFNPNTGFSANLTKKRC